MKLEMNLLVWCAKFSQKWRNFKKPQNTDKKHCFLAVFEDYQILAHQTNIFIFSIKFLISRHPIVFWVHLNSGDIIFGEDWTLLCHFDTNIWNQKCPPLSWNYSEHHLLGFYNMHSQMMDEMSVKHSIISLHAKNFHALSFGNDSISCNLVNVSCYKLSLRS